MTLRDLLDKDDMSIPASTKTFGINVPQPGVPTRANAEALRNALVAQEDGSLRFRNYRLTAVGLVEEGEVSADDWAQLGAGLLAMEGRLQWWLGDWALRNRGDWGNRYAEIVEASGREVSTIDHYAYVCRNMRISVRTENLTFEHHRQVAKFGEFEQLQLSWLMYVEAQQWSVSQMREAMRLIADLPEAQQVEWVQYGVANRIDLPTLRQAVKEWRGETHKPAQVGPFDDDQPALLKDVANLLKKPTRLAALPPESLETYAAELERIAQTLRGMAQGRAD